MVRELVVREAEGVVHVLRRERELFPFSLCGMDFDNYSLFIDQFPTLTPLGARRTRAALSVNNGHRRSDGSQARAAVGAPPVSASICTSRREKSTGLA